MSRGEGGGRPKKEIDPKQVEQLAMINCSYKEIAAVVGCDESTLTRRFAQVIQIGREHGKSSLKKKQFEVAMKGNVTMLIWLGKIMLGQRDNSYDVKLFSTEVQGLSDDELTRLAKKKLAAMQTGEAKQDN